MKILCVNSVISEYGGAEFAAMNLAYGLADRGHEIHFLGAKGQKSPVEPHNKHPGKLTSRPIDKIHLHYRDFPRTYQMGEKHGALRKLLWHAQDLAHPTNEALFAAVLRQVKPDVIILHNLAAVGLNIWRPIGKSGIPCIQVIHDLNMICFGVTHFRNGRQCVALCLPCRIQKDYRFFLIRNASNFAFVSPSNATFREIERYADLSRWRREIIPHANVFVVKPRNVSVLQTPRLLYVGRLDPSKGVEMMLRSAERAHDLAEFHLDILGSGSLERRLREQYASAKWVTFHGSVDQETVADFMSRATVLLVPSLWVETVGLVAVHALFAGLPVIGSRIGGIPEYIMDGCTGRLIPPGKQEAWTTEIVRILKNQDQVAAWSAACTEEARRFDAKSALDKYESLIQQMVSGRAADRRTILS